MDNVLFGRIAYQQADASDRIRGIMGELFDALDLYDDVLSIGLEFDVGSGGKRLTMVQRQKLNLARALLKRSDYFIFNRPLSALDQRVQDQITRNIIEGLHEEGHRPAIIWVLSNARLAEMFDRILLFDRGGLAEAGNFPELSEKNGMFKELLS
ncbi:ABC-type multidrug transport system fused ATPase/permease subunit [Rhizobium leguminosarum]|uniref:ABC-type multidrug transport system fused ATPase/permease subunit n=1 Tax=Rhizobium esperanzae TaxID=1967781 RepID=A0A7W6XVU5_9HYPH|nr:ABC-type multidrug transport system fused ATPase/permease subunit [Rhizobium esperanzae]MDH6203358.1 ABC-type multidrug transport system fused ATPase/permease subunit [Rhizobium leguminosarum]